MKRKILECDLCHKEIHDLDGVIELKVVQHTTAYPDDHYRSREKIYVCPKCQQKFLKIFRKDLRIYYDD